MWKHTGTKYNSKDWRMFLEGYSYLFKNNTKLFQNRTLQLQWSYCSAPSNSLRPHKVKVTTVFITVVLLLYILKILIHKQLWSGFWSVFAKIDTKLRNLWNDQECLYINILRMWKRKTLWQGLRMASLLLGLWGGLQEIAGMLKHMHFN